MEVFEEIKSVFEKHPYLFGGAAVALVVLIAYSRSSGTSASTATQVTGAVPQASTAQPDDTLLEAELSASTQNAANQYQAQLANNQLSAQLQSQQLAAATQITLAQINKGITPSSPVPVSSVPVSTSSLVPVSSVPVSTCGTGYVANSDGSCSLIYAGLNSSNSNGVVPVTPISSQQSSSVASTLFGTGPSLVSNSTLPVPRSTSPAVFLPRLGVTSTTPRPN